MALKGVAAGRTSPGPPPPAWGVPPPRSSRQAAGSQPSGSRVRLLQQIKKEKKKRKGELGSASRGSPLPFQLLDLPQQLLKIFVRLLEALERGELEAARVYAEQAKGFTEGLAA